jgi:hypothetical protein
MFESSFPIRFKCAEIIFWLCTAFELGAFCTVASYPMMIFVTLSGAVVYNIWKEHFYQGNNDKHKCRKECSILCKKKINFWITTTPILSILNFFFSMFVLIFLGFSFNAIVYMGGTYAALKMTTIGSLAMLENEVPETSTRSTVLTKITKIGGLIAGVIIFVAPLALTLLSPDNAYYMN